MKEKPGRGCLSAEKVKAAEVEDEEPCCCCRWLTPGGGVGGVTGSTAGREEDAAEEVPGGGEGISGPSPKPCTNDMRSCVMSCACPAREFTEAMMSACPRHTRSAEPVPDWPCSLRR